VECVVLDGGVVVVVVGDGAGGEDVVVGGLEEAAEEVVGVLGDHLGDEDEEGLLGADVVGRGL
jgi:hypothetical protein